MWFPKYHCKNLSLPTALIKVNIVWNQNHTAVSLFVPQPRHFPNQLFLINLFSEMRVPLCVQDTVCMLLWWVGFTFIILWMFILFITKEGDLFEPHYFSTLLDKYRFSKNNSIQIHQKNNSKLTQYVLGPYWLQILHKPGASQCLLVQCHRFLNMSVS